MRHLRVVLSIIVAFALLADSASAVMPYGYPRLDDRPLVAFGLAVTACKTLFLTCRHKTSVLSTAILMLVSTSLWVYSVYSIAMLYFSDVRGVWSLFQLLSVGYGLGILLDWPFVCSAFHSMRERGVPSFKATVAMQTGLYAVLLIIFLVSTHGLPPLEDSGGGGD